MTTRYLFTADHLAGIDSRTEAELQSLDQLHLVGSYGGSVSVRTLGTPAERCLLSRSSFRLNPLPHFTGRDQHWINLRIAFHGNGGRLDIIDVSDQGSTFIELYDSSIIEKWAPVASYCRMHCVIDYNTRLIHRRIDGHSFPPIAFPDGVTLDDYTLYYRNAYLYVQHVALGETASGAETLPDMDVKPLVVKTASLPDAWSVENDLSPVSVLNQPTLGVSNVSPSINTDSEGSSGQFALGPTDPTVRPVLSWSYRALASRDAGNSANLNVTNSSGTVKMPLESGILTSTVTTVTDGEVTDTGAFSGHPLTINTTAD